MSKPYATPISPPLLNRTEKPAGKIPLRRELACKKTEGEASHTEINKIKGVDFTKQFQALVNKYNERDEKDVLRSEVLEGFSEDKLIKLAKEVKTVVDENGYPPVDRDEVYREVFEQAENFKT